MMSLYNIDCRCICYKRMRYTIAIITITLKINPAGYHHLLHTSRDDACGESFMMHKILIQNCPPDHIVLCSRPPIGRSPSAGCHSAAGRYLQGCAADSPGTDAEIGSKSPRPPTFGGESHLKGLTRIISHQEVQLSVI